MAQAHLEFEYPTSSGPVPAGVTVQLLDYIPHLTAEKTGGYLIPLQRPLRWTVAELLVKGKAATKNKEDMERFIRGRLWPLVETALYAALWAEKSTAENPYAIKLAATIQQLQDTGSIVYAFERSVYHYS